MHYHRGGSLSCITIGPFDAAYSIPSLSERSISQRALAVLLLEITHLVQFECIILCVQPYGARKGLAWLG